MNEIVYTREEIEQKVKEIIQPKLGCTGIEIQPEQKLADDLAIDSLDAIEISIDIEKEFDIYISDDKIDAIVNATVGDIYTMVEQHLTTKNSKQ